MIRETYALTVRELKHWYRIKIQLFMTLIQPIVWLGLFGQAFQLNKLFPTPGSIPGVPGLDFSLMFGGAKDYFSFMAGVDWRFKPHLAALLQVDYLRPPIRGEVLNLTEPGIQLALGLRYRHSEAFTYEWRLVEDLSSFSPDFSVAFQMEVRSKGGRR